MDAVLSLATGQDQPAGHGDDGTAGGLDGVLIVGGILAWATGDTGRAQDLLLRALERSEGRDDIRRAAIACAFLGHVARARGEWAASAGWHQRAEADFRQGGNTQGVAWARHDLGLLARDRGDLDSAAELLRASLRDFRELDYPWAVAWSAWGLGTTLSVQGRLAEARPLLAEALRTYTDVNDPRGVAQCQEALACVASEQAHYETAARLIGAAAALRARWPPGHPMPSRPGTRQCSGYSSGRWGLGMLTGWSTLAGPCPPSRLRISPWQSLRAPCPVTRNVGRRYRSPRASGR